MKAYVRKTKPYRTPKSHTPSYTYAVFLEGDDMRGGEEQALWRSNIKVKTTILRPAEPPNAFSGDNEAYEDALTTAKMINAFIKQPTEWGFDQLLSRIGPRRLAILVKRTERDQHEKL